MSGRRDAPLAGLVELASAGTSAALRLFALNLAMARNFHTIASIPMHVVAGPAPVEEGHPLIDVERDGRIGIDLKFGSITFKEEAGGTFAIALVDVIVGASDMAPDSDTRVQMNVRLAADPDKEPILALTERFRIHIATILRAAAETIDGATARGLLFYDPEGR